MAAAAHPADLVDKRLIPAQAPDKNWLNRNGLQWFGAGENSDYLANRVVAISGFEMREFQSAADRLYPLLLEAARHIAQNQLWEEAGIPKEAVPLIEYSLREEQHLHLIGRYDFAGGLDGIPLKLLEFNADTFSLLPETVQIQPEIGKNLQPKPQPPSWQTFDQLVVAFKDLLRRYPDREPSILFSGMGYEEDTLNLEVMRQAARQAGFQIAQQVDLPKVIFSEDEGIFVELGPDRFQRYDFWFKMVPWDFICFEEPDLWSLLDNIIRGGHAIVINPALAMLLQSKALLVYLAEKNPFNAHILPAAFDESVFDEKKAYVGKPIYGRMGENIELYDQAGELILENEGDYGEFPYIYQEMTELNTDGRGYLYQPSVYWIQRACGICFRRQDDPAIDDDAEFIGHIVE